MAEAPPRSTRGRGRLEGILARWRMDRVLRAVRPDLVGGEILDIGCGSLPLFLMRAPFRRRVGVDQLEPSRPFADGLEILKLPLEGAVRLPFPDASFSCVTSLAVLEHLEPAALLPLMAEIHRVLKPTGQALITTPHAFADGPLRALAGLGWVSKEEVEEHKSLFRHRDIAGLFFRAGFAAEKIRIRGFLFGLNIFAMAEK